MCGIAAILCGSSDQASRLGNWCHATLADMLETLRYRGPDGRRVAQCGNAFLGHARLSIIDLMTGDQPIYNETRDVAVVVNGEIYNYVDLRGRLERLGHTFYTKSDSEVIVHLYEEYDLGLFDHLEGMFAFVLFDVRQSRLIAARDRLGEKPLLYTIQDGLVVFASELKAILATGLVRRDIEPDAVALYLQSMFIPAPLTIFRDVWKIKPGHFVVASGGDIETKRYWQPPRPGAGGLSESAAVERLQMSLARAAMSQTVADVPLGVFLSGGLDSGAVVASLANSGFSPINAFTIGFGRQFDEMPFARAVAKKWNLARHQQLQVDCNVIDDLETVLSYFDEPFGDSSALPTFLVSRAASEHVKVVLTGDGGDELLAGYEPYLRQKYKVGTRWQNRLARMTNRSAIGVFGRDWLRWVYPAKAGSQAVEHWRRVRSIVFEEDLPRWIGTGHTPPWQFYGNESSLKLGSDPLSVAFGFDLEFYLPDDLLKKVDMASMRNGLECRAPFLDYRMVEECIGLPPLLKVLYDEPKHVLRRAMKDLLPSEVIVREKQGFGMQFDDEQHGQVREFAGDLLAPGCSIESYIDPRIVQARRGIAGTRENPRNYREVQQFWSLLCFQAWMRSYSH